MNSNTMDHKLNVVGKVYTSFFLLLLQYLKRIKLHVFCAFNETVIQLMLVEYELAMTNSVLCLSLAIYHLILIFNAHL